jgi:L,D-transpeptidase YcbB
MAALHENQGDLAKAREIYDLLKKDGPDATAKQLASIRIDMMLRYTPNPLIGQPTKPKPDPATTQATQPATTQATQPATTQATQPTTPAAPATAPASATAPATKPASAPAQ